MPIKKTGIQPAFNITAQAGSVFPHPYLLKRYVLTFNYVLLYMFFGLVSFPTYFGKMYI